MFQFVFRVVTWKDFEAVFLGIELQLIECLSHSRNFIPVLLLSLIQE